MYQFLLLSDVQSDATALFSRAIVSVQGKAFQLQMTIRCRVVQKRFRNGDGIIVCCGGLSFERREMGEVIKPIYINVSDAKNRLPEGH